jgi:ABC-2 type transport system permease protein
MIFSQIASVTLRALVSRRRTVLMILLAAVPILVALLVRANTVGIAEVGQTLDGLVVRIILPLIALVFGTAALGMELEDGTGVHLLTKPISRLTIVLAKVGVAGALTAALVVPTTIIAAVLLARPFADVGGIAISLAAGTLVGSFLYAAIFAALGVITSRGLIIGLGYALIWEGLLAGILPGSQIFSVREYVRGIVNTVSPDVIDSIVGGGAIVYATIALVAAIGIAAYRLATYQVRGTD